MNKVELLSPAGDWASLTAAIETGCDAVYFGLKEFSMRANAKNFEISEMKKISSFCHENAVKCYLTLNTIIYDDEIPKLRDIVKEAKKAEIDAVMAWDMSVINICKENDQMFYVSTQASISNTESARYYKELGAGRVVLARELKLDQIKKIISESGIEVETFIHGAMCVALSGRCFMSQFVYGRSANRGDCIQPCRRKYNINDPETGAELEIGNNYVMSPKDLCALPFLDKLIEAGIKSFKIEGRNRSPEYVKEVTSAYRKAIDAVILKSLIKNLLMNFSKE